MKQWNLIVTILLVIILATLVYLGAEYLRRGTLNLSCDALHQQTAASNDKVQPGVAAVLPTNCK